MSNIQPNALVVAALLARYVFAAPNDLLVAQTELQDALRLSMQHTNAYNIPLDQHLPDEVDRDAAAPYVHPHNIAAALLSVCSATQPPVSPASDLQVYTPTGWAPASSLVCPLLVVSIVPPAPAPPPPAPIPPPPPSADLVNLVDAALAETSAPAPVPTPQIAPAAAVALAAPQSVPANPVPPTSTTLISSAQVQRITPLPPANVWPNPETGRIDTPLRYAQYQHDHGHPLGEGFGVGPDGIVYAIPPQAQPAPPAPPTLPPENDYRAAGSISTEAQYAQYRIDTGHPPPPGYTNMGGVAQPTAGAAAAPLQDPYLQGISERVRSPAPDAPALQTAAAVSGSAALPDPSVLADRTGESGKPQKSPFERKVEPRSKVADAPFWWKPMRYSMARFFTTNPASALDPSSTGSGPVQSYAVLLATLQECLRGVDGEVTVAELRQWMREVDTGIAALPSAPAINQLVDHLFD